MSWFSDAWDTVTGWGGDIWNFGKSIFSDIFGGSGKGLGLDDIFGSGWLRKLVGVGLDGKILDDTLDSIDGIRDAQLEELATYKKATRVQTQRVVDDLERERRSDIGSMVARAAASGVRVNIGSPVSTRNLRNSQFELDLKRINEDYQFTATGIKQRENVIKKTAKYQKDASRMNFTGNVVRGLFS